MKKVLTNEIREKMKVDFRRKGKRARATAVLALLLEEKPSQKVVVLGCGDGTLLPYVRDAGNEVVATNLRPGEWDYNIDHQKFEIIEGVDITKSTPFNDHQFDVVILMEVLEHIENHRLALREVSRILRPGGTLLFSTPNVMRLDSRLKFLLSGFHKPKRRFVRSYSDIEDSFKDHNYPVHLPLFAYLLLKYDLRIGTIISARRKTISYILYPILAPFVLANLYWTLFIRDKDPRQRHFNEYLWRLLTNRHVLMDDTLVFKVRKGDGLLDNESSI